MNKTRQRFQTILLCTILGTSAFASEPPEPPGENKPNKVAYVGSNSICYDGLIAVVDGRGCDAIRSTKVMDESYTIECIEKSNNDKWLEGTYYFIAHGSELPASLLEASLMCVDSSYTALWLK